MCLCTPQGVSLLWKPSPATEVTQHLPFGSTHQRNPGLFLLPAPHLCLTAFLFFPGALPDLQPEPLLAGCATLPAILATFAFLLPCYFIQSGLGWCWFPSHQSSPAWLCWYSMALDRAAPSDKADLKDPCLNCPEGPFSKCWESISVRDSSLEVPQQLLEQDQHTGFPAPLQESAPWNLLLLILSLAPWQRLSREEGGCSTLVGCLAWRWELPTETSLGSASQIIPWNLDFHGVFSWDLCPVLQGWSRSYLVSRQLEHQEWKYLTFPLIRNMCLAWQLWGILLQLGFCRVAMLILQPPPKVGDCMMVPWDAQSMSRAKFCSNPVVVSEWHLGWHSATATFY